MPTGGGLWLVRPDSASLVGNVFLGNRAGFGGGMSLEESDSLVGPFFLGNNLFLENVADHGGGLLVQETPRARGEVDYGSIWSNDSATVGRMYLKEEPTAPQGEWVAAMDWDFGSASACLHLDWDFGSSDFHLLRDQICSSFEYFS